MRLKEVTKHIDSIEQDAIEGIHLGSGASHTDTLAIIGLLAPLFIAILEVWKKIPGKKQAIRNLKLDKTIAALQVASLLSSVKFKK